MATETKDYQLVAYIYIYRDICLQLLSACFMLCNNTNLCTSKPETSYDFVLFWRVHFAVVIRCEMDDTHMVHGLVARAAFAVVAVCKQAKG